MPLPNAAARKAMVTSPYECRVGKEKRMLLDIIRSILTYPVGSVVEFRDEFGTEYQEVIGYQFCHDNFYILLSNGRKVHMNRMDTVVHSVKQRRISDGYK